MDGVIFLEQGWDDDARRLFYNEPQGSPIVPLAWFLALEQPGSEALLSDDDYLASLGLIPESRHFKNPNGLPVGLTEDHNLLGDEPMLGMNCSACHVGRMTANGKTVQLDGAPANFDFWRFMEALDDALEATLDDPERFARFAARVGEDPAGLRARLRKVVRERQDWGVRNAAPHQPGPGRVDALTVILNQVTAGMTGRPDNARPATAPVSYPFVWGAPYLDFVQYNGAVPNIGAGALARNVGQVLGVFGQVSLVSSTLPPGYASSISLGNLGDLEHSLETLLPPKWDDLAAEGILPPIDEARAARGAEIFDKTCKGCHGLMDAAKRPALAGFKTTLIPVDEIGTDPATTVGFATRRAASGPLTGAKEGFAVGEPLCEVAYASEILIHVSLGVLAHEAASHARQIGNALLHGFTTKISGWLGFDSSGNTNQRRTVLGGFTKSADGGYRKAKQILQSIGSGKVQGTIDPTGCGEKELPANYRARPLNAVWATSPFLHNGSVPSLEALLTPPAERPATFHVGATEFDPVAVGYASGPGEGRVLYDTSLPGNSNKGHDKGTGLDPQAKKDLLEYLKTL